MTLFAVLVLFEGYSYANRYGGKPSDYFTNIINGNEGSEASLNLGTVTPFYLSQEAAFPWVQAGAAIMITGNSPLGLVCEAVALTIEGISIFILFEGL
ncbi:hypothetical protein [Dehalococcoides mccartyi]|uniref:hypothetical protein n=1 Tax=Dehalococcoides mccartyi TaxID=61435 RepID=UPI000662BB10|nr:hypothetical protein [Dehalococcoides mccartyi]